MRLIDADAIKLEKGFFENIDNVPKFFEWLGKQPIIDPVKHGRWRRPWPTRPKSYMRICSECGESCWYCGEGDYRYCPNCGAKMQEGGGAE